MPVSAYINEVNMSGSAENRRIASNTIFLYLRMIVLLIVGLYTSRVVLAALGSEDYGINNVVGGVVSMFSFINAALVGVSQRFLSFSLGKGDNKKLGEVFSTCMVMHIIIAAITVFLAETIGLWLLFNKMVIPESRMNAAFIVFQASMINTFIVMISAPFSGAIIAHEKMKAFAYISLFEAFCKLGVAFIISSAHKDSLILYAILMVLVQISVRICYQIYCRKNFSECRYGLHHTDKALLKEMLGFGGWNLFGNMASVAMNQGVSIILNIFFGPAVNAARGLASQVEGCVSGFVGNFQTALNPQIIKSYSSSDRQRMHSLVYASGRYSFFLLLLVCLPLILEIEPILELWLEDVPDHTANFVRMVLVINLMNAPSGSINISSQATGNVRKVQCIVGSIIIMVIPFSYLALKSIPVPEIVFSIIFIILLCAQITRLLIVSKQINMRISEYVRFVYWPILKVAVPSTLTGIGIYMLFPEQKLTSFLIVCTVTVAGVLASAFLVGMNRNEREFIKEKIHGIFPGRNNS